MSFFADVEEDFANAEAQEPLERLKAGTYQGVIEEAKAEEIEFSDGRKGMKYNFTVDVEGHPGKAFIDHLISKVPDSATEGVKKSSQIAMGQLKGALEATGLLKEGETLESATAKIQNAIGKHVTAIVKWGKDNDAGYPMNNCYIATAKKNGVSENTSASSDNDIAY
jgi:hypothetical protein